ncbi:uncharacterized protein LOC144639811 [Oculina patagonica]
MLLAVRLLQSLSTVIAMERVKAESVSSTASSPDIPNLGKADDNREHVIESIPSENPVLIEETVQTDTTTRRNTKLKARKAQSTLKRKKEKITKNKSLGSLAKNTTLATIFSRIPLATLIEMAHERSR